MRDDYERDEVLLQNNEVWKIEAGQEWFYSSGDTIERLEVVDIVTDAINFEKLDLDADESPVFRWLEIPWGQFMDGCLEGEFVPKELLDAETMEVNSKEYDDLTRAKAFIRSKMKKLEDDEEEYKAELQESIETIEQVQVGLMNDDRR